MLLQARRNAEAAKRFFTSPLKSHRGEQRKMVTDKQGSFDVAHRALLPDAMHDTSHHANHRAGVSHELTRLRKRDRHCFKSTHQAQRFLRVHSAVCNLLNPGCHLMSARHYRLFRLNAFASWECETGP